MTDRSELLLQEPEARDRILDLHVTPDIDAPAPAARTDRLGGAGSRSSALASVETNSTPPSGRPVSCIWSCLRRPGESQR